MTSKSCAKCGRVIEYRKKWKNNWDEIRYCSERCRNEKLTTADLDYEEKILTVLHARSRTSTICPSEVLAEQDKKDKNKMELVREAARRLVHQNKIVITQKGNTVDPSAFKGPIRLKLK